MATSSTTTRPTRRKVKDYVLTSVDAVALHVLAGVTVWLRGMPGTAKTAVLRSLLRAMGYHFVSLILSGKNPVAIAGVTAFVDDPTAPDGKRAVNLPPAFAQEVAAHPRVVVFLDEVSTALPSQTAPALNMVQQGEIDGVNVDISHAKWVGAYNPASSSVGGRDLEVTMVNRGGIVEWPDQDLINRWLKGLRNGLNFDDVVPSFGNAPVGWENTVLPSMADRIGKYLTGSQSMILTKEKVQSDPFSTMRSWEHAIRVLAVAEAVGITDQNSREKLLGMHVDHAAAVEAATFLNAITLDDPADVLADKSYDLTGLSQDQRDRLVSNLGDYVEANETKRTVTEQALDLVKRHYHTLPADLLVPAARRFAETAKKNGAPIPREVIMLLAKARQA